MTAPKIVSRKLDTLKPYEKNPRRHPPEQIRKLAASIHQFGFTAPVLIDDKDRILAGHGRVLAAREAGLEKVPAIVASGWSEDAKRAYTIADNRLSESSEWDTDLLMQEFQALLETELDLDEIGLDEQFVEDLFPDWNPNLEPGGGGSETTAEDVSKARTGLGEQFRDDGQDLVDVECPACETSFTVDRKSL